MTDRNVTKYVFSKKVPFNLEILKLTRDVIKTLKEVKTIDVFAPSSTEFHPEGLFSTEIFGKVGSQERMERFAYIDLGLPIVHPLIYNNLVTLKSLYKDIIEGKTYAKFDPKLKDFVEAPITEGETGFNFFFKYYDSLQPPKTESEERKNKIALIKKYMLSDIKTDKWLVLPAGLRDYIMDEKRKHLENEINNYYRNIIKISKTAQKLSQAHVSKDDPIINAITIKLMKSVIELYEYILNILEGKTGFIQGKWAKRALTHGTRNVLTALPIQTNDVDKPNLSFNETLIGLFQFVKGTVPLTIYHLKAKFLNYVFTESSTEALLIDKKFKLQQVPITDKTRKDWLTNEGLEEITNKLIQDEIKNSPVVLDNKYYLFLVADTGDKIEVYRSIDETPEELRDKLRPITYGELFYLTVYDIAPTLKATVTRYPIDTDRSIYFTNLKLKTTIKTRTVKYKPFGAIEYKEVDEYPILGSKWFNSMSVHYTRLDPLGADYDGDKSNLNILYTEEALAEVEELMNSREYYVNVMGKLVFPVGNLVSDLALIYLTE